MSNQIELLTITAISIGFFHTLAGPDHYLPFIMMARTKRWRFAKTIWITTACGLGHVASSVVLGFIGIALGIAIEKLELIESFRGNLAAWGLTTFGFVYMIWGIWRAIKNVSHTHIHLHEDGTPHTHEHLHANKHVHVHDDQAPSITPWVLFTIFVFGPCEPLIPIIMYPAAQKSLAGLIIVTVAFGFTTILTMLAIVLTSLTGLAKIRFGALERYTHAFSGGSICLCGLAILFLGL